MMTKFLHLAMVIAMVILTIFSNEQALMAEPLRGHNLKIWNLPFVASLGLKHPDFAKGRHHFCSGSLIATNLVLTSAHCFGNFTYKQVDVLIGATDLTVSQPKYGVHSWITFRDWATRFDPRMIRLPINDIAIVELDSPVIGVTPATITTQRITDLPGKNATMLGWVDDRNGRARYLRAARVQILKTTDCQERFGLLTNMPTEIPEGFVCTAGDPFALNTPGDSGGPLLDRLNNILGITYGSCPNDELSCSQDFADQHRINLHVVFIDEYRLFIDNVISSFSSIS